MHKSLRLLMFFGAIHVGAAIQVLPRPISLGFMTGIAVLVVSEQLPALLGLSSLIPTDQAGRGVVMAVRLVMDIKPLAIILAFAALVLMVVCRRTLKHAPAGLFVVVIGALLVRFGHFPVRTIESLHGPSPMFPLPLAGVLGFSRFGRIVAPAFVIAVLVAIEALQAMQVATELTGERSNPDSELFLQGGANLASACVGSLPVSGVSSHTLENVRLGAQTPVAGILQAFLLVIFLVLAAPVVRFIPLPVMSALILSSVFGMTKWQEIPRLLRAARFDGVAWAAVSLLTIFADLPVAIAVGMLIGMFLHIGQKTIVLGKGAPRDQRN